MAKQTTTKSRRWGDFVPRPWLRDASWLATLWGVFFYVFVVVTLAAWRRVAMLPERDALGTAAFVVGFIAVYAASVLPRYFERTGRHAVWLDVAKRYKANRLAVAGFVLLATLFSLSVMAPLLAPHDPIAYESPAVHKYESPSLQHPMGTDRLGRDLLSRTLYGARVSLAVGVVAVAIASLLGLLLGAFSGYIGGRFDDVTMRIVDGLLAFPRLLLVLTLLAFFANSMAVVIVLLGATGWMSAARLVRGEVLRLKESEFVAAAVATGASRRRVVWQHLIPNALGPLVVTATLRIGTIVLLEAYLSFLGLGAQPPMPSWGAMVFDGRDVLLTAWWVSAFPGLAIVLTVMACNLVGDGLRDAVDVRSA